MNSGAYAWAQPGVARADNKPVYTSVHAHWGERVPLLRRGRPGKCACDSALQARMRGSALVRAMHTQWDDACAHRRETVVVAGRMRGRVRVGVRVRVRVSRHVRVVCMCMSVAMCVRMCI